ncbi:MAG: biotin/lipoyl-binding protein, partial [Terriglobia bacterium]
MALKRSYKIGLLVLAILVVVGGLSVWWNQRQAGVVQVQAGKVGRQDLASIVTASGEVRPQEYVNINSQSFGKIVDILVAEGAHVRRGQTLLRMEAVQPAAEVEATQASIRANEAAV